MSFLQFCIHTTPAVSCSFNFTEPNATLLIQLLHSAPQSKSAGKQLYDHKEMQGGMKMLRLTVKTEEYLMIGDNIKIVFLGGSKNHTRIMLDIPKEVNVVRSTVLEGRTTDPEEQKNLVHYHAVPELPEKYRKKRATAK